MLRVRSNGGGACRPPAKTNRFVCKSSSVAGSASECPVLSGLKPLPKSPLGYWESFFLQFQPKKHLSSVLAGGGKVAEDRFMLMPSVIVGDAELAKSVLGAEGDKVQASWPESLKLLLGENAINLVTDADHHRFLRRTILASMSADIIEQSMPAIQALVQEKLDRWVAEGEAGRTVKACDEAKTLTFLVLTMVLGISVADEKELNWLMSTFDVWTANIFNPFPIDKWPLPFYYGMRAREALIEYSIKQIAMLRAQIQSEGSEKAGASSGKPSILRSLVSQVDQETGKQMSDAEIADQMVVIMFAGHDTTANVMSNMLLHLSQHPKVVARIRAEQLKLQSEYGTQLTSACLKKMPYTEAVIMESMRTVPVVGSITRAAKRDFDLDGYLVPEGKMVQIGLLHIIQTDPRWHGSEGELDPNVYNPDRFMTDDVEKLGTQVHFGMGNRICPGQFLAMVELKMFLALLMRGYDFKADWNTEMDLFPLPKPKNGLPIFATRRV